MFIIGKLFTFLILPPGGFVLLLLLIIILAIRKRRIAISIIAVFTAALLYSASIRPVADALLEPLEEKAAALESYADLSTGSHSVETASYIVVLGGGVTRSRFGGESLSGGSLYRAVAAYQMHLENGLPIISTGGPPLSNRTAPEAAIGSLFLRSLGVEKTLVIEELESRNTWENAAFTKPIIADSTVILVTSAFHMRRSVSSFLAHGISVRPAPTEYRAMSENYTFWDWLPGLSAFNDSATALHEYVGLIFYRVIYGPRGFRLRIDTE